MKEFYTYIYYDPSRNNEPIYIGKGKDDRVWVHLKSSNKKSYFIRRLLKMKRNGINPVIGIINCKDEEQALSLEIWFIYKFGRKDLKLGTLLNLTDGGEGISGAKLIFTKEHKDKLSEASKGKLKSDEHKKNVKKARAKQVMKLGLKRKLVICPHCNTEGGANNMERYHFDNCKNKSPRTVMQEANVEPKPVISKIIVSCPHCGKSGISLIMSRWHFDKCKSKKMVESKSPDLAASINAVL